ncbi:uncharacterized protein LOC111284643 [Durio zibethinus]|uniref:Uncharacterized protein LOC111284643 n=1 Tax=Durio zibethinus TaxID=66656 RepID=A0A6P5XMN6_DURZI|nr:uncharacterized protein LOC111284643 [Durio zibethinus]
MVIGIEIDRAVTLRAAIGNNNMEGIRSSCVLSCYSSSSKSHLRLVHHQPFEYPFLCLPKRRYLLTQPGIRSSLQAQNQQSFHKSKEMLPKIDKSGRFCSPRAARELALLIVYAACLQGSDPIRLFEKRINASREPGYEFDKASLMRYNHMSFGGPPVTTHSVEEADELLRSDELDSAIEAEVLSAPPKLVYSKLLLRFTRKLLVAIVDKWDSHVLVIDKVVPSNWKNEPASRILELCILHLAMSEIIVLGTRHQIVINEAVDLAKRFCDGAAPRVINGCLRTFVKDFAGIGIAQAPNSKQDVPVEV